MRINIILEKSQIFPMKIIVINYNGKFGDIQYLDTHIFIQLLTFRTHVFEGKRHENVVSRVVRMEAKKHLATLNVSFPYRRHVYIYIYRYKINKSVCVCARTCNLKWGKCT